MLSYPELHSAEVGGWVAQVVSLDAHSCVYLRVSFLRHVRTAAYRKSGTQEVPCRERVLATGSP